MINKGTTPHEIFIQEDDKSMKYGVHQDESVSGMVKYVREDFVPNQDEMIAFAKEMTFHIDDTIIPLERDEIMARAFLEGYYFAKRHCNNKQVVYESKSVSGLE